MAIANLRKVPDAELFRYAQLYAVNWTYHKALSNPLQGKAGDSRFWNVRWSVHCIICISAVYGIARLFRWPEASCEN